MIPFSRTRACLVALAILSGACGSDPQIPPLVLSAPAFPDVRLGASISAKFTAMGGQEPYTFRVSEGALPEGTALDAATGLVTGVATAPGRTSFTITVTDLGMRTATAGAMQYVIPDPLEILTRSLPAGKEGSPYDQALLARGGLAPLVWTIAEGALPRGIALEASGQLAGTPSEYGGFDFTARVTDAEDTARDVALHLTLSSLNPMIQTSTVEKGRVGSQYALALVAEGGEPPYSWQVSAGALPPGVSLATNGELAGVPTEAGTFTAMVVVRDANDRTDMADVAITVIEGLSIRTTQLAQALRERAYRFQMEAAGGVPPYTWSLSSSSRLPGGITFDASGLLVGASSDVADHLLTIRVRDAEGFQASGLFTLRVTDRFTFEVTPTVAIPPTCTSTDVSYTMVPVEVTESMQIADVDVTVDVDYSWNPNQQRNRRNHSRVIGAPMIALYGPDGSVAFLCGDGVNVPGGLECDGGDMNKTWDDEGGAANRPEGRLSVFDGLNARGTWHVLVAISEPSCNETGTIRAVRLSIQDDRRTEPYVMVRGFRRNNLVTEPFLRTCSPACGGLVESELFLTATVYEVGANGFPEGGGGDDVAQPIPMIWSWQGAALPGVTLDPSGHFTIGPSNVTNCTQNHCRGTGQETIVASGGGFVISMPLRVVPPDWNPENREY